MAPIYELSGPYFYSHPSVREDFAKTAAGNMTDMEADGEAGLYMAVRGWQGPLDCSLLLDFDLLFPLSWLPLVSVIDCPH